MMELVVTSLRTEAEGIVGVELRDPFGAVLPAFEPGAHVDVTFANGATRQYSLVNAPADSSRYVLGVTLSPTSRGGSRYVHDQLRLGERLQVGTPRALFQLQQDAPGHLFIAGGIGITPILSMIRWCVEHQREWRLLYCVRSRRRAAYLDELARYPEFSDLHADDEHSGGTADLAAVLRDKQAGWHVYCCGPSPLMDGVSAAADAAGIDQATVHFERFSAAPILHPSTDAAFDVRLAKEGGCYNIPAGQSILSVLEASGLSLPSSCREGLCRSCEVPLVAGEVDHRDYVLSDEERAANRSILICVSRAKSQELVLDI